VAFKPFNDQFGYAFGDDVLKAFCEVAKEVIKREKNDIFDNLKKQSYNVGGSDGNHFKFDPDKAAIALFRHGGEEFSILFIYENFCSCREDCNSISLQSFFAETQLEMQGLCKKLYDSWSNVVLNVERQENPNKKDEYSYTCRRKLDDGEDHKIDFRLSKLRIRFGVADDTEYSRKSAENALNNLLDDKLYGEKMYTKNERGVIHEETLIHFRGEEPPYWKNEAKLIDHEVLFWITEHLNYKDYEEYLRSEVKRILGDIWDPLKEEIEPLKKEIALFYQVGKVTYIVIKTYNIVNADENALRDMYKEYRKNQFDTFIQRNKDILDENALPALEGLIGNLDKNSEFAVGIPSNTRYKKIVQKALLDAIATGFPGMTNADIRFLDQEVIKGRNKK